MKTVEELYEQARRHLQGEGIPRSFEKGIGYLKEAADLGHVKAQYNLGVYLHEGIEIAQSYSEAYSYFLAAAEQGQPKAAEALERIMMTVYRKKPISGESGCSLSI